MPQKMICELLGKLAHMKLNFQIEIEFHERNVIWQKFDMVMGQGWSKAMCIKSVTRGIIPNSHEKLKVFTKVKQKT